MSEAPTTRTTRAAGAAFVLLLFLDLPRPATAEEARADAAAPTSVRPILGARLVGRDTGGGVELDVRAWFPGGVQLGAALGAYANERAYMTGQAVLGVAGFGATGIFMAPLVTHAPITLDLRVESGASVLHDVGGRGAELVGAPRTAVRQTNEIGLIAHALVGDRWLFRGGALLGVDLEIGEAVELADQTQLLTVGAGYALGDHALLYGELTGGGSYGFDGDNGKFVFEGAIGLRFPLGNGGSRVAF